MARMRFPGRPGGRADKVGIPYSGDEISDSTDPVRQFIVNLHGGLQEFKQLCGESEDEEFNGFSEEDVRLSGKRLRAAIRAEQKLRGIHPRHSKVPQEEHPQVQQTSSHTSALDATPPSHQKPGSFSGIFLPFGDQSGVQSLSKREIMQKALAAKELLASLKAKHKHALQGRVMYNKVGRPRKHPLLPESTFKKVADRRLHHKLQHSASPAITLKKILPSKQAARRTLSCQSHAVTLPTVTAEPKIKNSSKTRLVEKVKLKWQEVKKKQSPKMEPKKLRLTKERPKSVVKQLLQRAKQGSTRTGSCVKGSCPSTPHRRARHTFVLPQFSRSRRAIIPNKRFIEDDPIPSALLIKRPRIEFTPPPPVCLSPKSEHKAEKAVSSNKTGVISGKVVEASTKTDISAAAVVTSSGTSVVSSKTAAATAKTSVTYTKAAKSRARVAVRRARTAWSSEKKDIGSAKTTGPSTKNVTSAKAAGPRTKTDIISAKIAGHSTPQNIASGKTTGPRTPKNVTSGKTAGPSTPKNGASGKPAGPSIPKNVVGGKTAGPSTPKNVGSGKTAGPSTPKNVGSGKTAGPSTPKNVGSGKTAVPNTLKNVVRGKTAGPNTPKNVASDKTAGSSTKKNVDSDKVAGLSTKTDVASDKAAGLSNKTDVASDKTTGQGTKTDVASAKSVVFSAKTDITSAETPVSIAKMGVTGAMPSTKTGMTNAKAEVPTSVTPSEKLEQVIGSSSAMLDSGSANRSKRIRKQTSAASLMFLNLGRSKRIRKQTSAASLMFLNLGRRKRIKKDLSKEESKASLKALSEVDFRNKTEKIPSEEQREMSPTISDTPLQMDASEAESDCPDSPVTADISPFRKGLLEQPLIVEGKRQRVPSLKVRLTNRQSLESALEFESGLFGSSSQKSDELNQNGSQRELFTLFPQAPASAPKTFNRAGPMKLQRRDKDGKESILTKRGGQIMLRKARLQLNRTALNRSKAALARSLKAQLKREAKQKGKRTELHCHSPRRRVTSPLSISVLGSSMIHSFDSPNSQPSPLLASLSPGSQGGFASPPRIVSSLSPISLPSKREPVESVKEISKGTSAGRTEFGGPRIKHVCRRAAVVLPKPLATFPAPHRLRLSPTLSALPSPEKEKLLQSQAASRAENRESSDEEIAKPKRGHIVRPAGMKRSRSKVVLARFRKRKGRCKECSGCLAPTCGKCTYCLDSYKYGGKNILKKACVNRTCLRPVYSKRATEAFIQCKTKGGEGPEVDSSKIRHGPARMARPAAGFFSSLADQVQGEGTQDEGEEMQKEKAPPPDRPRHRVMRVTQPAEREEGMVSEGGLEIMSAVRMQRHALTYHARRLLKRKEKAGLVKTCRPAYIAIKKVEKKFFPIIVRSLKDGDITTIRKFMLHQSGIRVQLPAVVPQPQPPVGASTLWSIPPNTRSIIHTRLKDNFEISVSWSRGLALTMAGPTCMRAVCFLCGSAGKEKLLYCSICCEPFHIFCLEEEDRPLEGYNIENWCCRRCQFCHVCGLQTGLLQCDRCQDTYHPECLGPAYPKQPSRRNVWVCTKCVKCKSCGATTPGSVHNATWTYDFSLCFECGKLMDKGNFCPVCRKCYADDDWESKMIQCSMCDSWVHARCEGLTDEMYQLFSYLPEDIQYRCHICSPCDPPEWRTILRSELLRGLESVLSVLTSFKCAQHLLVIDERKERERVQKTMQKKKPQPSASGSEIDEVCDGIQKSPCTGHENCDADNRAAGLPKNAESEIDSAKPVLSCRHVTQTADPEEGKRKAVDVVEVSGCSTDCVTDCHSSAHLSKPNKDCCDTGHCSQVKAAKLSQIGIFERLAQNCVKTSEDCQPLPRTETENVLDKNDWCKGKESMCSPGSGHQRSLKCNSSVVQESLNISSSVGVHYTSLSSQIQQYSSSPQTGTPTGTKTPGSSLDNPLSNNCSPSASIKSPSSVARNLFETFLTVSSDMNSDERCVQQSTAQSLSEKDVASGDEPSNAVTDCGVSENLQQHSVNKCSDSGVCDVTEGVIQRSLSENSKTVSCFPENLLGCNMGKTADDRTDTSQSALGGETNKDTQVASCDKEPAKTDDNIGGNSAKSGLCSVGNPVTESGNEGTAIANSENVSEVVENNTKKHVTIVDERDSKALVSRKERQFPRDFNAIRMKLEAEKYNSVEEFNEDVVHIIQAALSEDEPFPTRRKLNNSVKSIYIRHMERAFPWFNVKTCRLWKHNCALPQGMLPDAVVPPYDDHIYAQWLEREMAQTSPQLSPFRCLLANSDGDRNSSEPYFVCDDLRQCVLCLEFGDDFPDEAGRLLYAGQDDWVHVNCALWSAEVFEESDGTLQNVHVAMVRGRQLRCDKCRAQGATVGCCMRGCPANYHFLCARRLHCVFKEDKTVYCYEHREQASGQVTNQKDFTIERRLCVDMADIRCMKKSWARGLDAAFVNILVGSCTVETLGSLAPLSDCKGCLLPLEFRSSRIYWSTVDARQRTVYTCHIIEVRPMPMTPELTLQDVRVVHDDHHPDYLPLESLDLPSMGLSHLLPPSGDNLTLQTSSKKTSILHQVITAVEHPDLPRTVTSASQARPARNSNCTGTVGEPCSSPSLSESVPSGCASNRACSPALTKTSLPVFDYSRLSSSTLKMLNISDPKQMSSLSQKLQLPSTSATGCREFGNLTGLVERLNNAAMHSRSRKSEEKGRQRCSSVDRWTPSYNSVRLQQRRSLSLSPESFTAGLLSPLCSPPSKASPPCFRRSPSPLDIGLSSLAGMHVRKVPSVTPILEQLENELTEKEGVGNNSSSQLESCASVPSSSSNDIVGLTSGIEAGDSVVDVQEGSKVSENNEHGCVDDDTEGDMALAQHILKVVPQEILDGSEVKVLVVPENISEEDAIQLAEETLLQSCREAQEQPPYPQGQVTSTEGESTLNEGAVDSCRREVMDEDLLSSSTPDSFGIVKYISDVNTKETLGKLHVSGSLSNTGPVLSGSDCFSSKGECNHDKNCDTAEPDRSKCSSPDISTLTDLDFCSNIEGKGKLTEPGNAVLSEIGQDSVTEADQEDCIITKSGSSSESSLTAEQLVSGCKEIKRELLTEVRAADSSGTVIVASSHALIANALVSADKNNMTTAHSSASSVHCAQVSVNSISQSKTLFSNISKTKSSLCKAITLMMAPNVEVVPVYDKSGNLIGQRKHRPYVVETVRTDDSIDIKRNLSSQSAGTVKRPAEHIRLPLHRSVSQDSTHIGVVHSDRCLQDHAVSCSEKLNSLDESQEAQDAASCDHSIIALTDSQEVKSVDMLITREERSASLRIAEENIGKNIDDSSQCLTTENVNNTDTVFNCEDGGIQRIAENITVTGESQLSQNLVKDATDKVTIDPSIILPHNVSAKQLFCSVNVHKLCLQDMVGSISVKDLCEQHSEKNDSDVTRLDPGLKNSVCIQPMVSHELGVDREFMGKKNEKQDCGTLGTKQQRNCQHAEHSKYMEVSIDLEARCNSDEDELCSSAPADLRALEFNLINANAASKFHDKLGLSPSVSSGIVCDKLLLSASGKPLCNGLDKCEVPHKEKHLEKNLVDIALHPPASVDKPFAEFLRTVECHVSLERPSKTAKNQCNNAERNSQDSGSPDRNSESSNLCADSRSAPSHCQPASSNNNHGPCSDMIINSQNEALARSSSAVTLNSVTTAKMADQLHTFSRSFLDFLKNSGAEHESTLPDGIRNEANHDAINVVNENSGSEHSSNRSSASSKEHHSEQLSAVSPKADQPQVMVLESETSKDESESLPLHAEIALRIKAESLARSSPGESGPFKCPICKRLYRTVDSFQAHAQSCDFDLSTSDEEEDNEGEEDSAEGEVENNGKSVESSKTGLRTSLRQSTLTQRKAMESSQLQLAQQAAEKFSGTFVKDSKISHITEEIFQGPGRGRKSYTETFSGSDVEETRCKLGQPPRKLCLLTSEKIRLKSDEEESNCSSSSKSRKSTFLAADEMSTTSRICSHQAAEPVRRGRGRPRKRFVMAKQQNDLNSEGPSEQLSPKEFMLEAVGLVSKNCLSTSVQHQDYNRSSIVRRCRSRKLSDTSESFDKDFVGDDSNSKIKLDCLSSVEGKELLTEEKASEGQKLVISCQRELNSKVAERSETNKSAEKAAAENASFSLPKAVQGETGQDRMHPSSCSISAEKGSEPEDSDYDSDVIFLDEDPAPSGFESSKTISTAAIKNSQTSCPLDNKIVHPYVTKFLTNTWQGVNRIDSIAEKTPNRACSIADRHRTTSPILSRLASTLSSTLVSPPQVNNTKAENVTKLQVPPKPEATVTCSSRVEVRAVPSLASNILSCAASYKSQSSLLLSSTNVQADIDSDDLSFTDSEDEVTAVDRVPFEPSRPAQAQSRLIVNTLGEQTRCTMSTESPQIPEQAQASQLMSLLNKLSPDQKVTLTQQLLKTGALNIDEPANRSTSQTNTITHQVNFQSPTLQPPKPIVIHVSQSGYISQAQAQQLVPGSSAVRIVGTPRISAGQLAIFPQQDSVIMGQSTGIQSTLLSQPSQASVQILHQRPSIVVRPPVLPLTPVTSLTSHIAPVTSLTHQAAFSPSPAVVSGSFAPSLSSLTAGTATSLSARLLTPQPQPTLLCQQPAVLNTLPPAPVAAVPVQGVGYMGSFLIDPACGSSGNKDNERASMQLLALIQNAMSTTASMSSAPATVVTSMPLSIAGTNAVVPSTDAQHPRVIRVVLNKPLIPDSVMVTSTAQPFMRIAVPLSSSSAISSVPVTTTMIHKVPTSSLPTFIPPTSTQTGLSFHLQPNLIRSSTGQERMQSKIFVRKRQATSTMPLQAPPVKCSVMLPAQKHGIIQGRFGDSVHSSCLQEKMVQPMAFTVATSSAVKTSLAVSTCTLDKDKGNKPFKISRENVSLAGIRSLLKNRLHSRTRKQNLSVRKDIVSASSKVGRDERIQQSQAKLRAIRGHVHKKSMRTSDGGTLSHPIVHLSHQAGAILPQAEVEEEIRDTPLRNLQAQTPNQLPNTVAESWPKDMPRLAYQITSEDGFSCQADSMEEAWRQVTDKVQDARAAARMKQLSFGGLNGVQMFGVGHDAVVYLVEQLAGARHCRQYTFRYQDYEPLEEDELSVNPSGCARCTSFTTRNPYDVFSFLMSRHRHRPCKVNTYNKEEEMEHKSSRRATSMELPMAMRFRKLQEHAKEAVGVYRSRIHGRGLFCKRNIDNGEMVIEYSGEIIRSLLTDKREKYYESKGIGCYMFRIDDCEVVDATMHGSAARFINHSCEPNCYSKVINVDGKKHIVIFASRAIKKGEELTYDYKFPIEDVKIPCTCGSRRCRKYLN